VTENAVAEANLPLSALSANICAELAAGLADAAGIKKRYGLSDADWNRLKSSPIFRGMLKEALQKFSGDMNAGKRITIKSEIALEDSIPLLHDWAHDPQLAMTNRIDAIKQMSVLAGRTQRQETAQGAAGGGFNVNITIRGNDHTEEIVAIEGTATSIPQSEEEA